MMYQKILKAFTGEFHVKSTPLVEHEQIIVSGVQTGTLVNDGKGIIALYTANQIDGVMPPIRMQGFLTYNTGYSRFECVWSGSNMDGLAYYQGQFDGKKLVLTQVASEGGPRVITTEFIDDEHFNVLLSPSVTYPDHQSLSEFTRI